MDLRPSLTTYLQLSKDYNQLQLPDWLYSNITSVESMFIFILVKTISSVKEKLNIYLNV